MNKILFDIPMWPGSDPRCIRWTHVIQNETGRCYIVDTNLLVINPKTSGMFETTVNGYSSFRAQLIADGYSPSDLNYVDLYRYKWDGCNPVPCFRKFIRSFDNVEEAKEAHLEYCRNCIV